MSNLGSRLIQLTPEDHSKIVTKPSPVVLNWHGNAFVLPGHGSDDLFCRRAADQTEYTVLDANYALAPEYPFPTALEDVGDLVLQVLKQPDSYDTKNILLSGFSPGANLALAASANPEQSKIPNQAIRGVSVFYPPTSMMIRPADKKTVDGSQPGIPALFASIMNAFRSSYLPPGVDPANPRISVLMADPNNFSKHVSIITAEKDRLTLEAEQLAAKLEKAGKQVLLKRFDGVGHGWDKTENGESNDAKVRDQADDWVIKFLRDVKQ
jgi:acetyl esterase/lipase